jgi:DNA mismatch endonuclease, patch repair protein
VEALLKSKLPRGQFSNVPAARSAVMRSVRSKGNRTTELRLRSALVRARISGWKVQPTSIFGHPDFFFPDKKLAVFVDGCFWHGCDICGHVPRTNSKFWRAKIRLTKARDSKTTSALIETGVRVIRAWEHELRDDLSAVVTKMKLTLNHGVSS